jgi:replicative DNA helicase
VSLAGIQEPRSQMKAAYPLLRPADFKIPLHRSAFQGARNLFEQNEPVEPLKLASRLRGRNSSLAYLSRLAPNVVGKDEIVAAARRMKQRPAATDLGGLPTLARMPIRDSTARLALHANEVSKQVEQIISSGSCWDAAGSSGVRN